MIPVWMLIAKGAKKLANSENSQIDALNSGSNSMNTNNSGLGNAFSTFSSIYGNYLDSSKLDDEKKKKLFKQ